MRHERNQRGLAHIGALPRHVRAGDDQKAIVRAIEQHVVWHKRVFHRAFNDGMAAVDDLDSPLLVPNGSAIAKVCRNFREGNIAIQLGNQRAVCLKSARAVDQYFANPVEQLVFEHDETVFCAEDLLFHLLELRRNVPLGIRQRLLALILIRHLRQIGLCDLNIVPEHAVVTHAEGFDLRALALCRFEVFQPSLRIIGDVSELIHLGAITRANESAVFQRCRGLFCDCGKQQLKHILHLV